MRFVFIFIMIANSVLVSAQVVDATALINRIDSIANSKVGQCFSPFSATTLDGDVLTERDLIGKVTIINFWFTTCGPCVAEFDALTDLYNKFKNNSSFQFISFSVDRPNVAKETSLKYELPYAVCTLSREEGYRLNYNSGFPTSIIVDKFGKIAVFKTGGALDKGRISEDIGKLELQIRILLEDKKGLQ